VCYRGASLTVFLVDRLGLVAEGGSWSWRMRWPEMKTWQLSPVRITVAFWPVRVSPIEIE
jgi:hypothetical protein